MTLTSKGRLIGIHLEVYNYIVAFKTKNNGNSPTLRQIKANTACGSTSTVQTKLKDLESINLIERDYAVSKGIIVIGGVWSPPGGPL